MPDLTRRASAFRKSDWLRAGVLCVLVLLTSLTSTVRPSVLVAVPFLLLVGTNALRGYAISGATLIAIIIVMVGPYDSMWYLERGWALLLGGCFFGLSIARPKMKISDRVLKAVFGALVLVAILMTLMSGAWNIVDWVISDRIRATVAQVIALGGSEGLAPALITALYQTAEVQILIFPALTALASISALLLSWWLFIFFSGRSEEAFGSVKKFRFNDHLIWMLVVGLFLLFTRWSEPLQRLGSNAVVFIGALCAVRGAAVIVFITGGFSFLGYAMTFLGLVIVPPIVLGGAVLIGIADIYLDFRKRSEQLAAR